MFAVVVLLTRPRNHCIVPEQYIMGIDQIMADIKTWGVNRQHNYTIYWSRAWSDNREISPPNFTLAISNEYPPQQEINEMCYAGRIKRFFGKFLNCFFCDSNVDSTFLYSYACVYF